MKKRQLLLIPLVLAAGAFVARRCMKDVKVQVNCDSDETEEPTRDDPVYIRETATNGEGL